MLFTKKIRYSVCEQQIKEELKDESGEVVLKINLRFPEIKCPNRDPLLKSAAPFYKNFAEKFGQYAKTELFKAAKAAKSQNTESFMPYSAVMRWESTADDEKYLSIITDISVSNGKAEPFCERKTQIWDKKQGIKCNFNYFFDKKSEKTLLESFIGSENKKRFDKELFSLTENGFLFYLHNRNGFDTVTVTFDAAKEKNLLK